MMNQLYFYKNDHQQLIYALIYNTYNMALNEHNRLDLNFLGNNKLETESTFCILNEGLNNQILQISIPPNCSHYVRGQIVYTNNPDQTLPTITTFSFKDFLKRRISMDLWRNRTQQMQVVGLTHLTNRGPLLILDLFVYKESLYISLEHILASKYSLQNSKLFHPTLPLYQLVEFKEKVASLEDFFKNNQKIALQASSPIIEKYLGPGQPFSLHNAKIVAMSQTIQVNKAKNIVKLVGPGWVFFETYPRELNQNFKRNFMYIAIVYLTINLLLIGIGI